MRFSGQERAKASIAYVLTRALCRSRLNPKERRNSSSSGPHLRQSGGFFVPVRLFAGMDRRDACVGRAANTTPFGEIRPPATSGFEPPDFPSSVWRTGTSWNEETTMSKFETEDRGALGYFLSEDGQSRLRKLHQHIEFLARLTSSL